MPPSSINALAQMFERLGHQNVKKAEVNAWCNSNLDKNNANIAKCLTEDFIQQGSHTRELTFLSKEKKS